LDGQLYLGIPSSLMVGRKFFTFHCVSWQDLGTKRRMHFSMLNIARTSNIAAGTVVRTVGGQHVHFHPLFARRGAASYCITLTYEYLSCCWLLLLLTCTDIRTPPRLQADHLWPKFHSYPCNCAGLPCGCWAMTTSLSNCFQ
jgi:hypothetical protein